MMMYRPLPLFLVLILGFSAGAAVRQGIARPGTPTVKKISFVLTNDVHGHLEPTLLKNGTTVGGLSYLASYVNHLRAQTEYYNQTTGLFVLDSGDQFQGTLISNYDEGKAIFQAFNEVGYDAVVPGNHDYDFGPLGWLEDRVAPGITSNNPREVLEGLAKSAKFPLLSANTYYKATIRTSSPAPVVLNSSCEPTDRSLKDPLDFSQAQRPAFLKPYVIVEKAGVRVALIGLDNKFTATSTTIENIADLCFRDEVETYLEIRKQLEGQADVFVILMHNGNSGNSREATAITTKINEAIPNGVDLVAAGHTHAIHDHIVDGVHIMQDGANGRSFGRVDLFYDTEAKKVLKNKTLSWAAQDLDPTQCKVEKKERNAFVCEDYPLPVRPHETVEAIVARLRAEIAPLATKHVLTTDEPIHRDRINENALSNVLTDALRAATGADIAMMNTGGIRTDLPKGGIDYEAFFEILPFSNKVAIIHQVPWSLIKELLKKSAATCGQYGALMFSGLRVEYSRTCPPETSLDKSAKLTHVETIAGVVLFDEATAVEVQPETMFKVATLDFIAAGGSGYENFRGVNVNEFVGLARDLIADQLGKSDTPFNNMIDGRFKNIAPPTASAERATQKNPKQRH